ncbi:hypothetical protein FO519_007158 [Halicephalobus sp. NKZ332]|nr:hypothetical protein FO519_007158 [Halicephalobus sp. NKZ332]
MGNQSSSSNQSENSTGAKSERLLRRNKRTAFQKAPQSLSPSFGTFPGFEPRPSRSRSLEPQCAETTVKLIEHSQSARYPKNRKKQKNEQSLPPDPDPNSPLEDSGAGSPEGISICITGLSHHQKMIIQKIWMKAGPREIVDSGKNILNHLLRTNPNLFSVFRIPQLSEVELQNSPVFSLGGHHSEMGFPIEPQMWSFFQRVFEDNPPRSVHQNADGHQAWKLMIAFVVRQMRMGYQKAVRDRDNLLKVNPLQL